MNQEMLNGEKYVDTTAYFAIRNAEREGRKMLENSYAAGDIVNITTARGEDIVLIIKCNSTYVTTLKLFDNPPDENCICVTARTLMYADCGCLSYAYYDKILDLIRSMKDDEFDKVRMKITETLCLSDVAAEWQAKSWHPEERGNDEGGMVCGELTVMRDSEEHENLIKANAELKLMSELYRDLLDRMAGA